MALLVGLIMACVYTVLCIVASVLVFLKRDHHYMKPRDTTILFVQNAGSIASVMLLGFYTYSRPNTPCGFYLTAILLTYTTFAIPLLFRCWGYCVNFRISLLKRRFQTQYFLDWNIASTIRLSRFDKFQRQITYFGSHSFLMRLLAVEIVLLTVPITWVCFQPFSYTRGDYDICVISDDLYDAGLAVATFLAVVGLMIGMLIYKSETVYHGKFEIITIPVQWMVHVILFYFISKYLEPGPNYDASFTIIVAYFFTLFISCFRPLYYVRQFDKASAVTPGNMERFMDLLQSVEFRDAFHHFLTKQMCPENLQFYEVVSSWKTIPDEHPEKAAKARSIMTVFFSDESACQVYISAEMKEQLLDDLSSSSSSSSNSGMSVPSDMFDEVLLTLTHEMYYSSFTQFWVKWTRKIN